MRDLSLHRLIKLGATGTLFFGAQACGTSNEKLAKLICEGQKECQPEYFAEEFGSMDTCVDDYIEHIEYQLDYLEEDHGKGCARAAKKYGKCFAKEYKNSCSLYIYEEECSDEFIKYAEECDYGDYGDDYDY